MPDACQLPRVRRVQLHCRCGASLTGTFPDTVADEVIAVWETHHNGRGHGPCSGRVARAAIRAQEDAMEEAEMEERRLGHL